VRRLPAVLELDPAPELAGTVAAEDVQPSSDLRSRILAAVQADGMETEAPAAIAAPSVEADVPMAEDEVVAEAAPPMDEPDVEMDRPPVVFADRPRGRIRSGVARPAVEAAPSRWQTVARFDRGWLAAAVLAVVAVGAILWALALQGQIGDQNSEIDAQRDEIARLRSQANATAAILGPTADGPAGATGTLFFSLPQQSGVLVVRGLSALPEDQVYQLWFLEEGRAAPTPGPTFNANDQGEGAVTVAQDTPTFDAVALTIEPAGGSRAPTTPIILQGVLGGAAG
jgi:hypothetical protein